MKDHASEDDISTGCDTPRDLSWRDWRHVVVGTAKGLGQHDLSLIAAGIAFYLMLAFFPMLAAIGALYGLVADPADLESQLAGLATLVPPDTYEIIRVQVEKVSTTSPDKLTLGAIGGAAFAVWSARSGINAAIRGLNIVYDESDRRSLFWSIVMSVVMTFGLLLVALVAVSVTVAIPAILAAVSIEGWAGIILDIVRWPVGALAILFGVGALYRYGPARRMPRLAWITPGALLATFGWLVGSALFSYYVANMANYNQTYGSLGAVIGMLMWFYVSAYIILLGAQLNASLEAHASPKGSSDTTSNALA